MSHAPHEGECLIGINLTLNGYDPSLENRRALAYIREAVDWAEHLPEFADLVPLAEAVLTRRQEAGGPDYSEPAAIPYRELYIAVSREEADALHQIVTEASNYWLDCGYQWDPDEDDQFLGLTATQGGRNLARCDPTAKRFWSDPINHDLNVKAARN